MMKYLMHRYGIWKLYIVNKLFFRAGKLPDAKTPPIRLMSQSSVQSEISVGSPTQHEESEGSPASSPPPVLASVMSETIDVQTHYGTIDDVDQTNKNKLGPELVLTGTEDIKKPIDPSPVEKMKIKPKGLKGKDKKVKGALLKDSKKVKEKGIKRKLNISQFVLKKDDKPMPIRDLTVTSRTEREKKKLKKKNLKMKTKPSLTIRTDIPSTDVKSRGGRSPRGRSPKVFKSPTISIVSPVSSKGPKSPR